MRSSSFNIFLHCLADPNPGQKDMDEAQSFDEKVDCHSAVREATRMRADPIAFDLLFQRVLQDHFSREYVNSIN